MSKKLNFPLVGLLIVGVLLLATYSISVVGAQQQALTKEQLEEILTVFEEQRDQKSADLIRRVLDGEIYMDKIYNFSPFDPCYVPDSCAEWPPQECMLELNLTGVDIGSACYGINLKMMCDMNQVRFSVPKKGWPGISMDDLVHCWDNRVNLNMTAHALSHWGPGYYLFLPFFCSEPFDGPNAPVDVKAIFTEYPHGKEREKITKRDWEWPGQTGLFCCPVIIELNEEEIEEYEKSINYYLLPTYAVWFSHDWQPQPVDPQGKPLDFALYYIGP